MKRRCALSACKKEVALEEPTFPFCSPRCKLIDLGAWIDGRYVIAGSAADEGPLVESDVEVPEDPRLPRA